MGDEHEDEVGLKLLEPTWNLTGNENPAQDGKYVLTLTVTGPTPDAAAEMLAMMMKPDFLRVALTQMYIDIKAAGSEETRQ